jgi:hypothetical protein
VSKTQIRLVALAIPAAWAAINSVMYAADTTNRHRAESAWFLFSAALLIAAVTGIRSGDLRSQLNDPAKAGWSTAGIGLIASLASAFALYFPMLSIGLLSDDFVLVARAHGGVLVDAKWDYLRPLPIGIWRVLIGLSGVTAIPVFLHALNIGLHGVNAWLTAILATRLGLDSRVAVLAGLLFLVFPASVEAVVWASGVFDVVLVTLILAAGIALTSATNRNAQTIPIVILTIAALATKETAVVLPALLAIAAYAAPNTKRAAIPIAASIVLVGVYIVVRLAAGFGTAPPSGELTGYAAKELFSRPFGGLGLPFHIEVLIVHRWIPYALALYWPALFLISATRWHDHERDGRMIFALVAWIIVSVAPLATMLFIADDLQGARYLYVGTVAWSVMIVVLVQRVQPALRLVAIVPLLVVFAFAARAHQSAWTAAAFERDRVLDAYRNSGLQCTPTEIRGLPDQIRGAYLFRNGVPEALASVRPPATANPPCVLVWDGVRFIQE